MRSIVLEESLDFEAHCNFAIRLHVAFVDSGESQMADFGQLFGSIQPLTMCAYCLSGSDLALLKVLLS